MQMQIIKKPDNGLLATLLGVAIGVSPAIPASDFALCFGRNTSRSVLESVWLHQIIATAVVTLQVMSALSILEMFLRNAYEHGLVGISAAVLLGGLSYVLLQPYLPAFEVLHGASQVMTRDARDPFGA